MKNHPILWNFVHSSRFWIRWTSRDHIEKVALDRLRVRQNVFLVYLCFDFTEKYLKSKDNSCFNATCTAPDQQRFTAAEVPLHSYLLTETPPRKHLRKELGLSLSGCSGFCHTDRDSGISCADVTLQLLQPGKMERTLKKLTEDGFTDRLTFRDQINSVVFPGHVRAMQIWRCFSCKDVENLIRAFTTYVRPVLEYCSPVWCPVSVSQLESVQRRFTKRLHGLRSLILTTSVVPDWEWTVWNCDTDTYTLI